MSRYSYELKTTGITAEQKNVVDSFINNMKKHPQYSEQSNMVDYLSSRMRELCIDPHSEGVPLWDSNATLQLTNSSVGSYCPDMYKYFKFIFDNVKQNKTHTDDGIYKNYSVRKQGDSLYFRIFQNQSGKHFIVRYTKNCLREEFEIARGNRINVFRYCDCRDDNFIFGFNYEFDNNKEFQFEDDILMNHNTFKDLRYFCIQLVNIYDDLKEQIKENA